MEQRRVERFRKRVILVHWLQATSFAVLLTTGVVMFFDLTDIGGGTLIRTIHQAAALVFVIVPITFMIFDPKTAMSFVKTAFRWDRDDRAWLRGAVGFYFGRKVKMPPQGYINGDQKLWQLIVIITGSVFVLTGILMWFFKFKIPLELYQWVLLIHAVAFVVISVMFLVHLYLIMLHPAFEESLSSMVTGKVSASYAQNHYGKWYDKKTNEE